MNSAYMVVAVLLVSLGGSQAWSQPEPVEEGKRRHFHDGTRAAQERVVGKSLPTAASPGQESSECEEGFERGICEKTAFKALRRLVESLPAADAADEETKSADFLVATGLDDSAVIVEGKGSREIAQSSRVGLRPVPRATKRAEADGRNEGSSQTPTAEESPRAIEEGKGYGGTPRGSGRISQPRDGDSEDSNDEGKGRRGGYQGGFQEEGPQASESGGQAERPARSYSEPSSDSEPYERR